MLTIRRNHQEPNVKVAKKRPGADQARPVKNIELIGQELDQQQSLETVQSLLLISFSSICYLRNLLPDNGFDDREFGDVRTSLPRLAYPQNALPISHTPAEKGHKASQVSTKRQRLFKVITRSHSAVADKLYFWLEGIFHALREEYLDKVQLSIILDKAQPNHVIESYTFSFKYDTGIESCQTYAESTGFTSLLHKQPISTGRAKEHLCTVIRQLISLCQTLPNLPDKRFLTAHLFYNENCPDGYCPPGFQPNRDSSMLVPDAADWKMRQAVVGSMPLGFHDVELEANYLAFLQSQQHCSEELTIPHDISCTKLLRQVDRLQLGMDQTSRATANHVKTTTPSDFSPTQSLRSHSMKPRDEPQNAQNALNEAVVDSGHIKEMEVRQRLRDIVRTPSEPNDLTQTQPSFGEYYTPSTGHWVLIGSKDHELWEKRDKYIKNAALPEELWKCRCDCGLEQKEGTMIQCDCCDSWQHRHCYALENLQMGPTHVCYTCLLEDTESTLLPRMKGLSQLRRICWTIRNRKVSASDSALARRLGYTTKDVSAMLRDLKKQGIVRSTTLSKGDKRQLLVDEVEATVNFQQYGFLHPLASLQHYYMRRVPNMSSMYSTVEVVSPANVQCESEISNADTGTDELVALYPVHNDTASARKRKDSRLSKIRRRSEQSFAGYREDPISAFNLRKRSGSSFESPGADKRICCSSAKSPASVSERH